MTEISNTDVRTADIRSTAAPPRLPLEGNLDLTYRCNNACLHCWLWTGDTAEERARELSTDEWRSVVDQARALGCRRWAISGGEPMLRSDFVELLDYITAKAVGYSLNTNGTLITPEIAQLMKRRGSKMVAVYGASAEVYDDVTGNPGGFEAMMQGFAYLREAGAGFTVQLIPMRANWHQFAQMEELAKSLSSHFRVGAPWLLKSACGDARRNAEIERQRLDPADVVDLDQPDVCYDEREAALAGAGADDRASSATAEQDRGRPAPDDRLYASCIERRRDFHVDPYGGMTFCSFIKDPELRYDLRSGTVSEAWETFIPALADSVRGGPEYLGGCAVCDLRGDCRWCDVYGYLEHGRHGAKVEHLCAVARENRAFKERWLREHRCYFEIAGITVQVDSDLPVDESTFSSKFASFVAAGPGDDNVTIRHHFELPDLERWDLGREVYRQVPWAIYRQGGSWIYVGISEVDDGRPPHRVAVFSDDHTRAEIYNPASDEAVWRAGGLSSLSMLPTDQILLARVLADREGCYLHSGGVVVGGRGLLFVGHSTAGKSTTMKLFEGSADVLCDDRNIVRRLADGFRVYGTWSHGEVPIVSSASAPLGAILFLRKARTNRLERLEDRAAVRAKLAACLIRPLVTAEWWEKMLDLVEVMAAEVPCYEMRFDKSGAIVPLLEELARS